MRNDGRLDAHVDNNAFVNYLAAENLRLAGAAVRSRDRTDRAV